jgi:hypothetical protein
MIQMMTTKEAAKALGVAPATMRSWRCSEIGPPFSGLTKRSVKYDERDIQAYVAERRFTPSVHTTEVNRHAALQATAK